MRLIFDNEIEFLKRELGIEVPRETAFMDRMCVKVQDHTGKWHIVFRIKAKDMKVSLSKDNSDILNKIILKTWKDLIRENKEHLIELENKAKQCIEDYIKAYDEFKPCVPVSGLSIYCPVQTQAIEPYL